MENIVRRILREIFTEVIKTNHYSDRAEVGGRLSDKKYSTFTEEPQEVKDIVNRNLDYLQDIEFPEDIEVGILALVHVTNNGASGKAGSVASHILICFLQE